MDSMKLWELVSDEVEAGSSVTFRKSGNEYILSITRHFDVAHTTPEPIVFRDTTCSGVALQMASAKLKKE